MLLERRHRAGTDVRDRADVEDDAAIGQLLQQLGFLDGPDPVPDTARAEGIERAANGRRPLVLARVRHRPEALCARPLEDRRVWLGRVRLYACEADPDDTAVAVFQR